MPKNHDSITSNNGTASNSNTISKDDIKKVKVRLLKKALLSFYNRFSLTEPAKADYVPNTFAEFVKKSYLALLYSIKTGLMIHSPQDILETRICNLYNNDIDSIQPILDSIQNINSDEMREIIIDLIEKKDIINILEAIQSKHSYNSANHTLILVETPTINKLEEITPSNMASPRNKSSETSIQTRNTNDQRENIISQLKAMQVSPNDTIREVFMTRIRDFKRLTDILKIGDMDNFFGEGNYLIYRNAIKFACFTELHIASAEFLAKIDNKKITDSLRDLIIQMEINPTSICIYKDGRAYNLTGLLNDIDIIYSALPLGQKMKFYQDGYIDQLSQSIDVRYINDTSLINASIIRLKQPLSVLKEDFHRLAKNRHQISELFDSFQAKKIKSTALQNNSVFPNKRKPESTSNEPERKKQNRRH